MSDSITSTNHVDPQIAKANEIMANLAADGRFAGRLWTIPGKARVYVDNVGYIAIGQDGAAYPSLSRYRGNISRAAGI